MNPFTNTKWTGHRRAIQNLLLIAFCAAPLVAGAQEPATGEVEALRQQLLELRQQFERAQAEQRRQIEALTGKLHELEQRAAVEAEKQAIGDELAAGMPDAGASTNSAPVPGAEATAATPWSLAQPLTVARSGQAYLNLSFDALVDAGWSTAADPSEYLNLGDHDPSARGFSIPNTELVLDGGVDPYFQGFANIIFKLEHDNETHVELEEAYLQTSALPWNLQARAGQFFAHFGRQNPQHPHQWAFANQPLILNRLFGPDGLRNVGAQLAWLAPLPFFLETSLGVFNGEGGTAFGFRNAGEPDWLGVDRMHGRATVTRHLSGPDDLLYVPRVAASFDLTDQQVLVAGLSGAFGPNDTGEFSRTEIYGADVYWKWKSASAHAGFPFVSLQGEALYQRFGAGAGPAPWVPALTLPAESLQDWGFYSQVLWGFKQRWVAGLRGEYVNGNSSPTDFLDVFRGQRARVSPDLTFYPSEFSKIRLQYDYDQGASFGSAHSLWLQLEFLLGAHAAHKF